MSDEESEDKDDELPSTGTYRESKKKNAKIYKEIYLYDIYTATTPYKESHGSDNRPKKKRKKKSDDS